jgi:hypothetical protein
LLGRGTYRFLAVRDSGTGKLSHPIRRPHLPGAFYGPFLFDTASDLGRLYQHAADLVAHSASSHIPMPRKAARQILIPLPPL